MEEKCIRMFEKEEGTNSTIYLYRSNFVKYLVSRNSILGFRSQKDINSSINSVYFYAKIARSHANVTPV